LSKLDNLKYDKVKHENLILIKIMLKPVQTVSIFHKQGSPQTVKAGETIFTQGEVGQVMYGIVSGEVEMFVDGKFVETIKAGDVFGEGALIHPDKLRHSTAIAKTDCQLVYLDRERFLFAVQETPIFALEVLKSYSDRFRALKQQFTNL
jgi:CRP-like cAMP-binding protein